MSIYRRARKVDSSQTAIVAALRQAGVDVFIIGQPVDLLTHYRGVWRPIEVKPAAEPGIRVGRLAIRRRTDQERQSEFIRTFAIPVVRTPLQALEAIVGPLPGGLV